MHDDSPFYGYNVAAIQEQYVGRGAVGVVDFLLPHVKPGLSVLDAGCGPGTITQGLAEIAAPGKVIGCDLEPRAWWRGRRSSRRARASTT